MGGTIRPTHNGGKPAVCASDLSCQGVSLMFCHCSTQSQDLVKAELEADMMLDGEPEKETLPAQAEDDARGDAEVDMEVDRPDGDSEREKPHHEKKRHHHHRDGKGREKEKEKDATPIMNLLYMPGGSLPHPLRLVGKVVDIRIPAKYLTTKNREVATRQVWGTDVYTEDSDIVAGACCIPVLSASTHPPRADGF